MIETAYLHEYAIADQFMCESYFSEMDIDDNIKRLSAMEAAIASQEYFGESVEGELFVLEAEKKDIFTRIGEAIINLFKAFGETMGKIGTEIKDTFGKTKKRASSDAYRKAMQDNPEMAQEFLKAVSNGSIKAHDVKDLSALIDEATKLSNDLMKGRIPEDTFKGKMKNLLGKFSDNARNISTIIGLGTSAIALYNGVTGIRDRKIANSNAAMDRAARQQDMANAAADRAARARRDARQDIQNRMKYEMDREKYIRQKNKGNANFSDADVENQLRQDMNAYDRASGDSITSGNIITEAVSVSGAINKLMSFFAGHSKFCGDAVSKLNEIQKNASEQLKTDAGSNNTELLGKYNTLTSELRKVMNLVVKEENSILNLSNKAYGKMG